MTALDRYLRLEAVGLWRERADAPAREVIVSFGRSTLVLTDLEEAPLGHWALAGVVAIGAEDGATVYAMTADGGETLAIRDREMIAAIAAVSRGEVIAPVPPERARRRLPVVPVIAVAALVGLAVAAPRAIRAVTAELVPQQAAEIGDRMLIALIERHGPPCASPDGEQALARLARRLDPERPPRLRVMDVAPAPAVRLPGGTVIVDRTALAAAAVPEEVAGWAALAEGRDPVAALVAATGPLAALGYVFTGELGEATLARAAEAALAPPGPGEAPAAADRLRAAGIDPRPFLAALARGAGQPATLPESREAPSAQPALANSDWVALRGICS